MSPQDPTPTLVRIGRIARPHGVRGAVALTLDNPESESLFGATYLYLRQGERSQRYGLRRVQRGRKGQLVLHLEGVASVEAAELLREHELLLEEGQLPALGDAEFWQRDLLGLRALDSEGTALGEVVEVVDTAEIPVLVVRGAGQERFVPFTRSHVRKVDLDGGCIHVDAPEELG